MRTPRYCLRAATVVVIMLGFAGTASANPRDRRGYLAELVLVLEGSRRTLSWTERYIHDDRLAQFAQPLAERFVQMVGHMTPPKSLTLVHPHLLLIAENVERAVAAAGNKDLSAFRQRRRVVREEIQTLDGILKHLKIRLPELAR
jgi:hypothetical protein